MNVHLPAPSRGWPARLVNLTVVIVVLALAAATFVLSYAGVHAIALHAGVSPRLARIYPGVFDAVLVIACAAAVMLRYARWWARCYAWLAIIVVIGVVGAADAVHAMNVALPHRQTEGVVAAAPWVLVLLGFSLMLTMLRQSRGQHAATPVEPPAGLTGRPVVPALAPAAMPGEREVSQEPSAADLHPPTLVVPAFTEPDEPPAAPAADADHGDPGDPGARDDEGTGQEPADWAAAHAAEIYPAPPAGPAAGWLERVADSGDPGEDRHDYWDTDDEAGLTTVPRLNRVRATPIPPEEEDE